MSTVVVIQHPAQLRLAPDFNNFTVETVWKLPCPGQAESRAVTAIIFILDFSPAQCGMRSPSCRYPEISNTLRGTHAVCILSSEDVNQVDCWEFGDRRRTTSRDLGKRSQRERMGIMTGDRQFECDTLSPGLVPKSSVAFSSRRITLT